MFCEHFIHIIDQTGTEDDLHLIPRHEHAFCQIHILDCFQICNIIVLQNNPQTCRTMSHALNIIFSADQSGKFYGYFFIPLTLIRIHFLLLLYSH